MYLKENLKRWNCYYLNTCICLIKIYSKIFFIHINRLQFDIFQKWIIKYALKSIIKVLWMRLYYSSSSVSNNSSACTSTPLSAIITMRTQIYFRTKHSFINWQYMSASRMTT